MRRLLCLTLSLYLFPLAGSGLHISLRGQSTVALENQVSEWVKLRTEIASEIATAHSQEEAAKREEDLLARELHLLTDQVAQLRSKSEQVGQESATFALESVSLAQESAAWSQAVDDSMKKLLLWSKRLPPGLEHELDGALEAAQAKAGSLVSRANAMAEGWEKLRTLSRGFHVKTAVVSVGGGDSRRLNILYAGLSRAWAIAPDQSFAAIGVAREDGWQWDAAPEHLETIRNAISIATRKQPPALIALPVRLPSGGAP